MQRGEGKAERKGRKERQKGKAERKGNAEKEKIEGIDRFPLLNLVRSRQLRQTTIRLHLERFGSGASAAAMKVFQRKAGPDSLYCGGELLEA